MINNTINHNHTGNNNTVAPIPTIQSLCIVSALFNVENYEYHIRAIHARDEILSLSNDSYNSFCIQLLYVMIWTDQTLSIDNLLSYMNPNDVSIWKTNDMICISRIQQNTTLWIQFGQMAGYILKNALLHPPQIRSNSINNNNTNNMIAASLDINSSIHIKDGLLHLLLNCHHKEICDVISTIISTIIISKKHIQPLLHVSNWNNLMPQLIDKLLLNINNNNNNNNQSNDVVVMDGVFSTILKMMEDGPNEFPIDQLDQLIPILLLFLNASSRQEYTIISLQILCECLITNYMPNTLIIHFNDYLNSLSTLAAISKPTTITTSTPSSFHNDTSSMNYYKIRKWVCRNIVTLLDKRTEYMKPYFLTVTQFMLQTTVVYDMNNINEINVALEACDYWLTFANLDTDTIISNDMIEIVQQVLVQLIPILVQNMIYPPDKQHELLYKNELDEKEQQQLLNHGHNNSSMKPIFHKSKAQPQQQQRLKNNDDDDADEDLDDDGDDDNDIDQDDDEKNEWTLRKCAAASLDSLSNLYGGEIILPIMLPILQNGLVVFNNNIGLEQQWIQEASILALGAIAEGCHEVLSTQNYLTQIYPYLLQLLSSGSDPNSTLLPQVKSIVAWTIGQYAHWIIEQVQNNSNSSSNNDENNNNNNNNDNGNNERNGNLFLLQQITEIFLIRLRTENNTKVQIACCAAFGVLIENAGDLMIPYLENIYHTIFVYDNISLLHKYNGRSLLMLFDLLGVIADCCGPAIAEKNLPIVYIPPLLRMWDGLIKNNPADRTMLPLMECLACISINCNMNYQPYAFESFENAMYVIEQITLLLAVDRVSSSSETATFEQMNNISQNEEEYDHIICAADLIDGLVEGLGINFISLLNSSVKYGPLFLNVLLSMCQHDVSGVRMSALALLGDLARNVPIIIQPAIPQLIQEAINSMDPINPPVATNAVWAVGEICVKCVDNPDILAPYASSILQNLISLLVGNGSIDGHTGRGTDIPGLAENASACVGRLAKVNPNFVAPDVSRFLLGWCDGMSKISDPIERRDAFQGFVQVVYTNPQAIQTATTNVTDAIVSILLAILTWHIPSDIPANEISTALFYADYRFQPFPQNERELGSALFKLVHDMKTSVGDETWYAVEKQLPVNVRRLLKDAYQL